MKIINFPKEATLEVNKIISKEKKIGVVPTMGYLHEGHLSLVKQSKKENDCTIATIFVNPIQFAPNEDLDKYPSNIARDIQLLENEGVDILFMPNKSDMYPKDYLTSVKVSKITDHLCGAKRAGHFEGVTTVVCKLFNILKPNNAYFGEKDYQQLQVIKRMTSDLNIDVNIVGMPIVRENDGLAMSSRNVYLNSEERSSALSLNRSFNIVSDMISAGIKDTNQMINDIWKFITSHPYTKIDYIEIVDPSSLESIERVDGKFLLALAVFVGKARLIDNKLFEV